MDVSFLANGTASLSNLIVTKLKPRTYASNATTPLWAVEDTGMNISDISPFWSIVDDKYEHWPGLRTKRRNRLYLPAGASTDGLLDPPSAHAGAAAPQAVLATTYSAVTMGISSVVSVLDYSGSKNYPLFLKWQKLSESPETSSTIPNLIWTDMMANYVMGTRSTIGQSPRAKAAASSSQLQPQRAIVRVHRFERTVRYDLRYAVPAFIFLALYVFFIVSSFLLWIFRRAGVHFLHTLLNQTSTGRAVTVERYGGEACATIGTRSWIMQYGSEDVGIRKRLFQQPDSDHGKSPERAPRPDSEDPGTELNGTHESKANETA